MRSRHLVALPAAAVLIFSVAGCGKSDPTATATTPITVASTPAAADGSTGGDTSATGSSPTGGTANPPQAPARKAKSSDTITVVASKDDDLTNLSTALGAANLTSVLAGSGQYTVFAPNNDGFAKLGTQLDTLLAPSSQDQLANILKFHVVKGRLSTKKLKDGELLTTLQGTRLRVTKKGNTVQVGNSNGKGTVVDSDIDASNGIVHVIDTVLTPKS